MVTDAILHFRGSLRLATAALTLVVITGGCDESARAPDQDFQNFVTAVANASADGYTPYWLGSGFAAGGLEFTGPATGDFGDEVAGGGAQYLYHADVPPGPRSVSLRVTLYSAPAWDKVKAAQGTVPSSGTTVTEVTIAGYAGRVLEVRDRLGALEQLRLIVQLGDTTVVATANPGIAAPPTPDLNPLTDKPTFISVVQNLRPYPQ